jgi:hypothetical protein
MEELDVQCGGRNGGMWKHSLSRICMRRCLCIQYSILVSSHRMVIGHMSGLVAGSYCIIHYTVHLNYIISYGSKGGKNT